jgi:anthranilate phosphoribosyltransferase
MQIQQALQKLLTKQNLTADEMREVMRIIMSGGASDAQIAGFLIALRCKGETVDEIATAVEVMRELASKVPITGEHVIDTCGTGGDGANTFNISTTCAFVVAAAGGQVAKHGNRSVSSSCGSADVLEAAGVNLDLSAEQVAQCVHDIRPQTSWRNETHHQRT